MTADLETLTDPAAILEDAIARLDAAVHDRKSPFRTPVLATADADARVVVLREATQTHLSFHTDLRSPKVTTLRNDPRATLLFYDASQKLQLRVAMTVTLHSDDRVADEHWAAAQEMARRCYSATPAPTTAIDSPDAHDQTAPDGRRNFVVARGAIVTLEWLYLRAAGHRRLRVTVGERRAFSWLAP